MALNHREMELLGTNDIRFRSVDVDGLNISYRVERLRDAPALLLFQGFPTSSRVFRPRAVQEFLKRSSVSALAAKAVTTNPKWREGSSMKSTVKKIAHIAVAGLMSIVLANSAVAEQHQSRAADDLVWENGAPGIDFALVWGDWSKDEYGMLVRIRAGVVAPRHSHTADYHGVTIQGNWVHTYGESDERILDPGGYAFQSGEEDHGDRCAGPEDCLILIHQHGPRDFVPAND